MRPGKKRRGAPLAKEMDRAKLYYRFGYSRRDVYRICHFVDTTLKGRRWGLWSGLLEARIPDRALRKIRQSGSRV